MTLWSNELELDVQRRKLSSKEVTLRNLFWIVLFYGTFVAVLLTIQTRYWSEWVNLILVVLAALLVNGYVIPLIQRRRQNRPILAALHVRFPAASKIKLGRRNRIFIYNEPYAPKQEARLWQIRHFGDKEVLRIEPDSRYVTESYIVSFESRP